EGIAGPGQDDDAVFAVLPDRMEKIDELLMGMAVEHELGVFGVQPHFKHAIGPARQMRVRECVTIGIVAGHDDLLVRFMARRIAEAVMTLKLRSCRRSHPRQEEGRVGDFNWTAMRPGGMTPGKYRHTLSALSPEGYWLISGSTSLARFRSDSCQPR